SSSGTIGQPCAACNRRASRDLPAPLGPASTSTRAGWSGAALMGPQFTSPLSATRSLDCRTMAASDPTKYRTLPARIVGWGILIAAAGIAVAMGMIESDLGNNPLSPTAFLAVLGAIVWILL